MIDWKGLKTRLKAIGRTDDKEPSGCIFVEWFIGFEHEILNLQLGFFSCYWVRGGFEFSAIYPKAYVKRCEFLMIYWWLNW